MEISALYWCQVNIDIDEFKEEAARVVVIAPCLESAATG